MSNPNPPSGENQNWPPQPPPQPQPQPPQQAPATPPRQMPQLNMQNINELVTSVPRLVRGLRLIAWAELIVIVGLSIIGFCSTLTTAAGLYYSGGLSALTSLLVTILQALVFWGLLMGVALLLENQTGGRRSI
jgi:hypothetical protein